MGAPGGGASEDPSGKIIQHGKETHGSVAAVIVSLRVDMPLAQGLPGLRALQRLPLALLIAAKHNRTFWRIE